MTDKNRRLMKINRIISNKKNVALIVIAIDVLSFLLINFIINSFAGITSSVGGKGSLEDALTVLNILPNMNMIVHSKFVRSVYTVLFLFIAVLDVAFVYQIKFAYSEEEKARILSEIGDAKYTVARRKSSSSTLRLRIGRLSMMDRPDSQSVSMETRFILILHL